MRGKKNIYWAIGMILMLFLLGCKSTAARWQEQYDLGVHYLDGGNYEEAIIAFTAAIEIDGVNPDGYLGLAKAYEANGDIMSSVEALRSGWAACTEKDIFLEELGRLGYIINESNELQEIDWTEMFQTVENIFHPQSLGDSDYLIYDQYLTYEQMRVLYEPLIPLLQKYVRLHPDSVGINNLYQDLAEIYCRLNEMDLCLQVRAQGYENTGDEWLKPEEHIIAYDDHSRAWTYDAWGRCIMYEINTSDGYWCETREYGEGTQLAHVRSGYANQKGQTHDYQFENGRIVSVTDASYWAGGSQYEEWTYEYPEPGKFIRRDGVQINTLTMLDGQTNRVTIDRKGSIVYTLDDYGHTIHADYYDNGEYVMSKDYSDDDNW